jgi:hypothetical protein
VIRRWKKWELTEAEEAAQTQEAEGDGDTDMDEWDGAKHTPNIQKEVEDAWSKLPKKARKNNRMCKLAGR